MLDQLSIPVLLLLFVVALVLAVPAAIVICSALGALVMGYERFLRPCPGCRQRGGMVEVDEVKVYGRTPSGELREDWWWEYRCEKCGKHFKQERGSWFEIGEPTLDPDRPFEITHLENGLPFNPRQVGQFLRSQKQER